jgi:hypothetical protein
MKKIQYFKLFESRTAELTEEEFYKILKDKCSDYVNDPVYLQRIKGGFDGEYTFINPKMHVRNPLTASSNDYTGDVVFSKHHTLLMDNLPSWNDFCKRSESVIFSTSPTSNSTFGNHHYYVIPYNNSKFSVAPLSDIWQCKSIIKPENNATDFYRYSFNDIFSERMLDAGISDESYDSMINDLNDFFQKYKNGLDVSKFFQNIFEKMKEDGISDVSIAFDKYFDPNNFEKPFKTMNYSSLKTEIDDGYNREVWTDSECLLVYSGEYKMGAMLATRTLNERFEEFKKKLS